MTNFKVKAIDRKIELFEGRPDRDTIIGNDDILNLNIALNSQSPEGVDPLHYFLSIT
jgi:hypothetical protein